MQSVGQHWIWHESGVPCHGVSGQNPGTQKESTPMNIKNVAVALVALIASSAAQAQEPMQWRVEDGGSGHWYEAMVLAGNGMNWVSARSAAQARGADLVSLESASEAAFATPLVNTNLYSVAWIGLFQQSSACEPSCGWTWVSGASLSDQSWGVGEPNNAGGSYGDEDHAVIMGVGWGCGPSCYGKWADWPGSTTLVAPIALIEWSADCNGDGIVDYGQCRDGSLPDYNGNNIPDCCESGTPCVVGNYPVQWRVEDGGNGHWYRFVIGQTISWDDARAAAVVRGGYLASVTSLEESDFVVGACSDTAGWIQTSYYWLGPWLGGYQPPNSTEPAGGWTWLSDEPWGWTRWWPGSSEPNNGCSGHEDYLVMCTQSPLSGPSGWWNDSAYPDACGGPSPISYLIEWSADCNNDGIVDIGQIYLQPELYADANSNGIPDSCEVDPCPGDITGGGFVDAIDLSILLAFWGSTGGGEFDADVNNDGIVEGADLTIVLTGWGPCPN